MTAMIPLDAAATPGMETITNPLNVLSKLSLFMFVANHRPADEYDLIQGRWLDWPRKSWAPEQSDITTGWSSWISGNFRLPNFNFREKKRAKNDFFITHEQNWNKAFS